MKYIGPIVAGVGISIFSGLIYSQFFLDDAKPDQVPTLAQSSARTNISTPLAQMPPSPIGSSPGMASPPFGQNGPFANTPAVGDALLAGYKLTGIGGKNLLDEIYARGLSKTTENFKAVSDLMKSNKSSDERAQLAQILGTFYSKVGGEALNERVLSDLRQMASSNDAPVVRAALLAYSRMGYNTDTEDLLSKARTNKSISDEDYFLELAHLAPHAPANSQARLVETIRLGGNVLASQVLGSAIRTQEGSFSPTATAAVKRTTLEHEPEFPKEANRYGLLLAVNYADWLSTIAKIEGGGDQKKAASIVMQRLSDSSTDPRKIMSYLVSASDSERFIRSEVSSEQFQKLTQRIEAYASENKDSKAIQDVLQGIRHTIQRVKSSD